MFDRNKITTGMVVRSSDGDKLGKVIQIDESGLIVEKGIFFPKDYRVSFDQVDNIGGDDLYLKWGTELVEENYDTTYGTGSYARDTSDESLWSDWRASQGSFDSSEARQHMSVPLREEELQAKKEGLKERGMVRIVKTVRTEDKHFTVPLRREELKIERVPASGAQSTEQQTYEKPVSGQVRKEEAHIEREGTTLSGDEARELNKKKAI